MPVRALLFFLVLLVPLGWHLDHGTNDNTMARAATVASLVDRGTLEITPIHTVTGDKALVEGRYFSDKAPLPTFLVLPFHAAAVRLGLAPRTENGSLSPALLRLGGLLCGTLPLALIITLLWTDLAAAHGRHAALLATMPVMGSFLFVYSGSFYNHLLGALFVLLGARAAGRKAWMEAATWGGAAFLCESVLLVFPMFWALQAPTLEWRRNWPRMALGLLPSALLAAWHNAAVTGSPFVFPNAFAVNYQAMHSSYGFGTWQPQAWLHLLWTDYRGLFFYMPVLWMGLLSFSRWHLRKALGSPYVAPSIVLILAFLTHATWWGGWTYGPRYLMAPALLLLHITISTVPATPVARRSVLALATFGMVCAAAAKSTVWYSFPTGVMHPLLTEVWPRLLSGNFTDMQWPVWLGISPTMGTLLFLPATAGCLVLLHRITPRA